MVVADVLDVEIPGAVAPYDSLTEAGRTRLRSEIAACAAGTETEVAQRVDALVYGLQTAAGDAVLFLGMLRAAIDAGHFRSELSGRLLPLIAKAKPKAPKTPKGGVQVKGVPFAFKPGKKTAEQALVEWQRKGTVYPADMLDWNTGAINWHCQTVYGFKRGSREWLLYAGLIQGAQTYDALRGLVYGNVKLSEWKAFDRTLKAFLTKPLPPGAGSAGWQAEQGLLWIVRDPSQALAASLPWRSA